MAGGARRIVQDLQGCPVPEALSAIRAKMRRAPLPERLELWRAWEKGRARRHTLGWPPISLQDAFEGLDDAQVWGASILGLRAVDAGRLEAAVTLMEAMANVPQPAPTPPLLSEALQSKLESVRVAARGLFASWAPHAPEHALALVRSLLESPAPRATHAAFDAAARLSPALRQAVWPGLRDTLARMQPAGVTLATRLAPTPIEGGLEDLDPWTAAWLQEAWGEDPGAAGRTVEHLSDALVRELEGDDQGARADRAAALASCGHDGLWWETVAAAIVVAEAPTALALARHWPSLPPAHLASLRTQLARDPWGAFQAVETTLKSESDLAQRLAWMMAWQENAPAHPPPGPPPPRLSSDGAVKPFLFWGTPSQDAALGDAPVEEAMPYILLGLKQGGRGAFLAARLLEAARRRDPLNLQRHLAAARAAAEGDLRMALDREISTLEHRRGDVPMLPPLSARSTRELKNLMRRLEARLPALASMLRVRIAADQVSLASELEPTFRTAQLPAVVIEAWGLRAVEEARRLVALGGEAAVTGVAWLEARLDEPGVPASVTHAALDALPDDALGQVVRTSHAIRNNRQEVAAMETLLAAASAQQGAAADEVLWRALDVVAHRTTPERSHSLRRERVDVAIRRMNADRMDLEGVFDAVEEAMQPLGQREASTFARRLRRRMRHAGIGGHAVSVWMQIYAYQRGWRPMPLRALMDLFRRAEE